jgi:hypothetical protein
VSGARGDHLTLSGITAVRARRRVKSAMNASRIVGVLLLLGALV